MPRDAVARRRGFGSPQATSQKREVAHPAYTPCLNSRRMECVPNGYNDRVKFFERKIGKQGENEYGAYRLKGVKLHLKKKPGVAQRRL